MRRRHGLFLAVPIILLLVVITGWNRTSADDQTEDFRLNQIMVKLDQIERELSQVKNRFGTQENRFDHIDRQMDRILKELEKTASTSSTESVSSSDAVDPALVGTWKLSRNDFAEEIPNNIRRYLAEQAAQSGGMVRRVRTDRMDRDITEIIVSFEEILNQTGLRQIQFRPDGMYTDSTGDKGLWLVSGERLILTTFDGRAYPGTYSLSGAEFELTFPGDQIGTLFRLEAGRSGGITKTMIDQAFQNKDRVRLIYTRDF